MWRGVERAWIGCSQIKIADMMLYYSQVIQMFCHILHLNTTQHHLNTFSGLSSVSNKNILLKDITYCVARHQNLKHYSTFFTREKPGIALTSFCLVWRSYNPMWVFLRFPYGWKQISTGNVNIYKVNHCFYFFLPDSPLPPAPSHTSSHTSLSYKQAVNYLIPRKWGKKENKDLFFSF